MHGRFGNGTTTKRAIQRTNQLLYCFVKAGFQFQPSLCIKHAQSVSPCNSFVFSGLGAAHPQQFIKN